jgi:hypothetical protein
MNRLRPEEPMWLVVAALVLFLFAACCGGFWALDWYIGRQ